MTKKRRGSSKAGRPRKEGERFPGGKLKAVAGPNEIIIAERRRLLGLKEGEKGDLAKASNPIDLAHARGWLSDETHRTAVFLARVYRRSGIKGPDIGVQNLHEVDLATAVSARTFAAMSDEEVTAVFDKVFSDDTDPADRETQSIQSTALWGMLMAGLPSEVQAELFWVCVQESWPQWVVYRAANKVVPDSWDRRRLNLEGGLAEVRARMRAMSRRKADLAAANDTPPTPTTEPYHGPKVEEHLAYVDEDGTPLQPTADRTGLPFEVYRKRRA